MSCLFGKIPTSISRDLQGNKSNLCHQHLPQDFKLAKQLLFTNKHVGTTEKYILSNVISNIIQYHIFLFCGDCSAHLLHSPRQVAFHFRRWLTPWGLNSRFFQLKKDSRKEEEEMQYLILTSSSNFLHNVSKNVTNTIFNAFANGQIMCENLLIFSPVWFYEWGSKISRYTERSQSVPKPLPQVRYKWVCGHPSYTTIPPATTNIQIAALVSWLLISVKQLIWLWKKGQWAF